MRYRYITVKLFRIWTIGSREDVIKTISYLELRWPCGVYPEQKRYIHVCMSNGDRNVFKKTVI